MILNIRRFNNIWYFIDTLIVFIICIFPVTTLLQGFSIFSPINKLLVVALICLMLLASFYRSDRLGIIVLIFSIILSVIGVVLNSRAYFGYSYMLYFFFFIVFLEYCRNSKENIKYVLFDNIYLIKFVIVVFIVLVLFSMLFKSSYKDRFLLGKTFISFCDGASHRLASACYFILVLIMYIAITEKKKKYIVLSIFPVVFILMTMARVFLLSALGVVAVCLYVSIEDKKRFWEVIVVLVPILIVAVAVSPMGKKIFLTFHEHPCMDGLMASLTSGRSLFWVEDVKGYWRLNVLEKIIGAGVGYPFFINNDTLVINVQAHCDYINIIMQYGLAGLCIYFIQYFRSTMIYNTKGLFLIGFSCIMFLNAVLNGLYTYPCVMLSIPIFLSSYRGKKEA